MREPVALAVVPPLGAPSPSWKYRRDYVRRCRECGHPIVGAARNQRMHNDCRKAATARTRKLRRECRRAALGMWPGDRVPLEEMVLNRRAPTPETRRRYYGWHTCAEEGCEERFFAGKNAKFCHACAARRRRAQNARRSQAWAARHRDRWRRRHESAEARFAHDSRDRGFREKAAPSALPSLHEAAS